MNSSMEKSYPAKLAEDHKKHLLHKVSKKIFTITKDLPELDVLDYNISKTERRVTLSKDQSQLTTTEDPLVSQYL